MKLPLSLDVLVLLLLVPAHMQMQEAKSYLLVIQLLVSIAYIGLELWHPLSSYGSLPNRYDRTRVAFLIRLVLILVMVTFACVVPTARYIFTRLQADSGNADLLEAYSHIHDGAIQTEDALGYLRRGKNPYSESYEDSLLVLHELPEIAVNPAIDHYVYLPGILFLSLPSHALSTTLLGFYDQRIIYLIMYLATVLMVPMLAKSPERKLSLTAAVGLNPLLVDPVIFGMNDVVILMSFLMAAILLIKERPLLSALAFGLGCASKQTAWLSIPFYLALLVGKPFKRNWLYQAWKPLGILLLVMVFVLGPFVAWDARAFIDDVFSYPAGTATLSFPIRGYSLAAMLLGLGIISSPFDQFPFWILQLVFGIPLLLFLLKYQLAKNDGARMFVCAGLFLFGIGFLSRFFQYNYVGLVTTLITIGVLFDRQDESKMA
jgi:hypothetical protein